MAKKNVRTKGNKGLVLKISLIVLLILIAGVGTWGFVYYKQYKQMEATVEIDTIYNNVYVNNVNLGGFTKEQAIEVLKEQVQKPLDEKDMILTHDTDEYTFTYSQFGAKYDLEAAVEEAYNYGRIGSLKERYEIVIYLDDVSKFFEADYSYDADMVTQAVKTLEDKIYVEPTNATITRTNGKFVITPEKSGIKIDVERTAKAVCEMLDIKQDGNVIVATQEVKAKYTSEDFNDSTDLIGAYSTSYSGGDDGRITNMKVAASKVNGTVIYPGEVFSTNACFGAMTYDNGYRPAPVIVSGKLVDDLGGGVCQISSTLYNTILYAELDIVERQNHSLKVGYTDYGFDATLAGDYIDFKFKNSTEKPIYLEAYLTSNKVIINAYGNEIHSPNRKITFENALVETIEAPAEKITYDATLPEGTRETVTSAKKGYRYKVYKLIYENGSLIDKVQINTSYYKPRAAEVKVGTKKVEQPANATTDESVTETTVETATSNTTATE